MADDVKGTGATTRRERLTQRRKALGLTQEDLAALLDVERSTVARWERGQTEPVPWIQPKLAKALRVPADRLGEILDDAVAGAPGTVVISATGGTAGVGETVLAIQWAMPAADGLAGLYRSLLAGEKLLIVLECRVGGADAAAAA